MLQLREEMAQRKREEKDTVLPRAELEMFSRSVESVDEDLVDEELAMLDDVHFRGIMLRVARGSDLLIYAMFAAL